MKYKTRYWLLTLCFLTIASTALAQRRNILSVPDTKVSIGQALLPVTIENTDEIVGLQFDITLPTAVTAGNEAVTTNRCDGHTIIIRKMEATRYRVMLYSEGMKPLIAQQGTVFFIPITTPQSYSQGGEHPMSIGNATMTIASGENVLTDAKAGKLIVSDLPDLTVKNIQPQGLSVVPDERFSLSWQVQNVGGAPTGKGWSEQILLVNKLGTRTKLLATTYCEESLAAGASLNRQAEITIPKLLGIDGNAYLQVRIVPTSETGESTAAQGNNMLQATQTFTVAKRLFIETSPAEIAENSSQRIMVKVSRSGDWSGEQTFTISSSDARLRLPQQATIPAGQSGVELFTNIMDNSVVDDNDIVTVTASGNGYPAANGQLIINDNEMADLTLTASKSTVSEGETFQLTVSTATTQHPSPITVTLTSEHPKRFSFPQTVSIPVGKKTAVVEVTAIDDDLPAQTLSTAFTASAPRHNTAEAIVLLQDNDLPVLTLELSPAIVQESAGPLAVAATLRRTSHTDSKITVRLTDDANGALYYANQSIELAKGVEEVHFNLGPVDNASVDGDRNYTLTAAVWLSSCSCSAVGESAGSVTAQLRVLDDDGPALSLSSSKATVKEGDKTTLTIERNTSNVSQALTVALSSDYDAGLTYNHSVTIPAGKKSATVEVTAKTNSQTGDNHTVVFTAQSSGYASATCYIMVTDQTLPDARISSLTANVQEAEVGTEAQLTMVVNNEGVAELPAVAVKVYRQGEAKAVTTLYTSEALAAGGSQTLNRNIILPTEVGRHQFYAVVNESGEVKELSHTNNTSQTVAINTIAPYSITVATNKTTYKQGETVVITGQLTGNNTAGTAVDLYIINEGARQVFPVTTDQQGAFRYEYTPYSLQSGHFIVGACYPNEGLTTEMTAFDVYGLRRTDNSTITCKALLGETYNGTISLSNPGNLALNNVRVQVLSKPDHLSTTFSSISKIAGGATKSLSFTIGSSVLSPSNEWEEIKIRILTNEGVSLDATLYYHNSSPNATLSTDIARINTTMSIDESSEYAFYVTNTGQGATGNISLGLPSWMKSSTSATISSLDNGESVRIVLLFTPTDDMQPNVPLTGNISINCENGNGVVLPYSVKPVSERTGTMVVDVTDEYTYYTDEQPHVENAHVVVRQPLNGQQVAEGNTNANGLFSIELPAGYYEVTVSAAQHDSYANSILVAPGTETPVDVFLSCQAITYSWDVVETEVEDVYDIVTTVNYDTRVPKPVVVANYPEELTYENQIVNIIVTNKGLVSAFNVGFDAQIDHEGATFQPLVSLPIDTLKPQTSVAIPILMTVTGDEKYESQGSVSFGGTYYGDDEPDNNTANMSHAPKKDEIEEVSPGCWKLTFTVPHDRKECNKQTGQWETVGTEYTSHTWYYGQCGGGGSGPGGIGGGIWLPDWFPTWNSGPGSKPTPPNDPPKDRTHPNEDDNKQHTQVFDGCTTDCTDSAVDAAAGCAAGLIPGPVGCVAGLAVGCHNGFKDRSSSINCILAGLGCVPAIGPAANAIGCAKGIYDAYDACIRKKNGKNNAPELRNTSQNSLSLSKDNYEPLKLFYQTDSLALEKVYNVLGDGNWDNVTGQEFETIMDYLWENMSDEGVTLADNRISFKPQTLTEAEFDNFLVRIDNSIKKDKNPSANFDNVIDLDRIIAADEQIASLDEQIQEMGYGGIAELSDSVASHYSYLMRRAEERGSSSVCATITLQFSQQMVMTRQAFRGTLTVFNGNEETAMQDVKLNLTVTNTATGVVATSHEFQINAESLEGFSGQLALDAGWSLAANGTGTATVLFIPTKHAAPTEPVDYAFGGTLSYIDPFTGLEVTRQLYPVTLTVKPSPELDLTYFMQRDVYGDDPLTLDVVEPKKPAEFALLIDNKGNGDATNVRMVTQQPEIIENAKGLAIDFEIISSQVNGGDAALSFGKSVANDFGTIPAHSQLYAQWWLQSSLLGHFTDYDVTATHVSSYGNPDLSLLGEVSIHELIHGFNLTADGKSLRAFLVNDIPDANDLPDKLYFSNGDTIGVINAASASVERISPTSCRLTVTPSKAGWNYGSLLDPTYGLSELKSIVRESDGKELSAENFWQTDRTLRDGKDWLYENRLHFVDDFASEAAVSYLLTFEPLPEILLEVERFDGIPQEGTIAEEPINSVQVVFNKPIAPNTFTADDITFTVQGTKQDASLIGITTADNRTFTLNLTAVTESCPNGYYVLTVQTAGITDFEGYQGRDGRQASWVLFRGGLVQLLTSAYPVNAGSVSFVPLNAARTLAPRYSNETTTEYGSTLRLTATPEEGYELVNWTLNGDVISTETVCEVLANSDLNIVANFQLKNYLVEVGAEGGGIVEQGATGYYAYGEKLTLTAVPNDGYQFERWMKDDKQHSTSPTIQWTVNGSAKLSAVFSELPYATLSGTVRAANTLFPIKGATVSLKAADKSYSSTTNATGRYSIQVDDRTQLFNVFCQANGYIDGPDSDLSFDSNTATLDFDLLRGATVRMPEQGICTFSSTVSLDFSANAAEVKAYYADAFNSSQVLLRETQTAAAGEGLILSGTPSARIDIPEADHAVDTDAANLLVGTAYAPFTVSGNNVFVLNHTNGNTAFYRAAEGVVVPQYKAYLMSTSATSDVINMLFGLPTSVNAFSNSEESDLWYQSDGKKIGHHQRGINVTRRRKVTIH